MNDDGLCELIQHELVDHEQELTNAVEELVDCQQEIANLRQRILDEENRNAIKKAINQLECGIEQSNKQIQECRKEIDYLFGEIKKMEDVGCDHKVDRTKRKKTFVNNIYNSKRKDVTTMKKESDYYNIDWDIWIFNVCNRIGGAEMVSMMCHEAQSKNDIRDRGRQSTPGRERHQKRQAECPDL